MKRIMIASIVLQLSLACFSQTDSSKFHKNEISPYLSSFKNPSFGIEYNRYYRPDRFISVGVDRNRFIPYEGIATYPLSVIDSVFSVRDYYQNYSSLGMRFGKGWVISDSRYSVIFSADLLGGSYTLNRYTTTRSYKIVSDSIFTLIPNSYTMSLPEYNHGFYAGASASFKVSYAVSEYFRIAARVSTDLIYNRMVLNKTGLTVASFNFNEIIMISSSYVF